MRQYGLFVDHDERYELSGEYWDVFKRLTAGEVFSFEGRHIRVENAGATFGAPPVQKPHVPLWFGGSSEAGLQMAAQHIDTYLSWGEPPDLLRQKIDRLRGPVAGRGPTSDSACGFTRSFGTPTRRRGPRGSPAHGDEPVDARAHVGDELGCGLGRDAAPVPKAPGQDPRARPRHRGLPERVARMSLLRPGRARLSSAAPSTSSSACRNSRHSASRPSSCPETRSWRRPTTWPRRSFPRSVSVRSRRARQTRRR